MKDGKVTITLERFKELEALEKNFKAKLNERTKEIERAANEATEIARKMILEERDKLVARIGARDEQIAALVDKATKLHGENDRLVNELASAKSEYERQLGVTSQLRTNEKFYMDRYLELEKKMWSAGLFRRVFKAW